MSNERTASALGSDPEELSPTASGEIEELREANAQLFEIGQKQHRQIQADDYTIRRMQAALRCARGWLITCSESATARADLKTLDAALERSPPPANPPPALNWRPDREAVAREVDPEAFAFNAWNANWISAMARRKADALAKADRILALPSQPQTGGEG